ncbi:hypothetical protein SCHPADRAFT_754243 [Schizopora paradoxa]|uniref:Uncharacterized protein n=1 Tax=Schizopora paradoxa TaxID=27342 RepID=A0A0H2R4U6_9AGAM|nr:hypothetical protein SCHPADRAFT_754243 [Schizopora paradoxa]
MNGGDVRVALFLRRLAFDALGSTAPEFTSTGRIESWRAAPCGCHVVVLFALKDGQPNQTTGPETLSESRDIAFRSPTASSTLGVLLFCIMSLRSCTVRSDCTDRERARYLVADVREDGLLRRVLRGLSLEVQDVLTVQFESVRATLSSAG